MAASTKKSNTKSKSTTFKVVDVHSLVTNKLIETLEAGVNPWACPWDKTKEEGLPISAVTGLEYQGMNIFLLLAASVEKGFRSRSWMTFKQAKALGANIRKGERSTMATFFKKCDKKDVEGTTKLDENGNVIGYFLLKNFAIFNLDQIENLDDDKLKEAQQALPTDVESFLTGTGAEISVYNGTQAYFSPSDDNIVVPSRKHYASDDEYYATVFHELTHWTGGKTRLSREMSQEKGSYAFEELIAEMGSMFLKFDFGFNGTIQNHASYIDHWLKALKNDKKFVFKAASAASKARQFLHSIERV